MCIHCQVSKIVDRIVVEAIQGLYAFQAEHLNDEEKDGVLESIVNRKQEMVGEIILKVLDDVHGGLNEVLLDEKSKQKVH